MTHPFQVGDVTIGGGSLFLIAGPCVIESEAHALKMADAIAMIAHEKKLPYIFKASYDKANRTSIRSFRGPGLAAGLRVLRKVRETVNVPVLTDVHAAEDVASVAEAVDVIQIPAFLCRQTDLLIAAGKSGRAVNIKKGQFVSPWDMRHAVEKVRDAGGERIFLTERGASFGYNNLVVDMRSLAIMREFAPVVFDATHSVQLPSAAPPTVTARCREWRPARVHSAAVAGCGCRWRRRRLHGSARQPGAGEVRWSQCARSEVAARGAGRTGCGAWGSEVMSHSIHLQWSDLPTLERNLPRIVITSRLQSARDLVFAATPSIFDALVRNGSLAALVMTDLANPRAVAAMPHPQCKFLNLPMPRQKEWLSPFFQCRISPLTGPNCRLGVKYGELYR